VQSAGKCADCALCLRTSGVALGEAAIPRQAPAMNITPPAPRARAAGAVFPRRRHSHRGLLLAGEELHGPPDFVAVFAADSAGFVPQSRRFSACCKHPERQQAQRPRPALRASKAAADKKKAALPAGPESPSSFLLQFRIHNSQFLFPHSLFPIHYSQFALPPVPPPCSRLPTKGRY
jgi:hypothetical protein